MRHPPFLCHLWRACAIAGAIASPALAQSRAGEPPRARIAIEETLDTPVAFADKNHPFAAFDEDPPKAAIDNDGQVAVAWMTRPITRDEFFATPADVFIPAALELEIGIPEAKSLAVRLIVEGANGPTETAAEPILRERGIDVIPDILANSGGVVVSYYEWLQNKRSERWELEEVEDRLAKRMKRTYLAVSEYAASKKCDWRMAAMGIALDRIGRAYAERGIFP